MRKPTIRGLPSRHPLNLEAWEKKTGNCPMPTTKHHPPPAKFPGLSECDLKGHQFTRLIIGNDGNSYGLEPLPCCARCGCDNPAA